MVDKARKLSRWVGDAVLVPLLFLVSGWMWHIDREVAVLKVLLNDQQQQYIELHNDTVQFEHDLVLLDKSKGKK